MLVRFLAAVALLTVTPFGDARAMTDAQAAAARPLKMIWGANQLADGRSAFPTYERLGVDVLQLQLSWSQTAPKAPASPTDPGDPAYRWPQAVDVAVREAGDAGMRVALQVTGAPPWTNGGRGPQYAPKRPVDYARFLTAAARRYPAVRHWMIWGEPTRPGNFLPMDPKKPAGTRLYARILDAAYGAIKKVDRRDQVIGGMTWTFGVVAPPRYLKWLRLPDGRVPRLDMWGHNPFSRRFPRLSDRPYYAGVRDLNDIDTLRDEVWRTYRRAGRRPKLWLSEYTISSDRVNRAYDFFVSQREQARWLSAAYRLARQTGYVAGLGWFNLQDGDPSEKGSLTTGLLTHAGEPKPAFEAYARVP